MSLPRRLALVATALAALGTATAVPARADEVTAPSSPVALRSAAAATDPEVFCIGVRDVSGPGVTWVCLPQSREVFGALTAAIDLIPNI